MIRSVLFVGAVVAVQACATNPEPKFFVVSEEDRLYEVSVWKPVPGSLNDALEIAMAAARAYCVDSGQRFDPISESRDPNTCNIRCGVATVQFTCEPE